MSTGLVTAKHDVVCQGCGGQSGTHKDFKCPFLVSALKRVDAWNRRQEKNADFLLRKVRSK
jgi:hypothetical protein